MKKLIFCSISTLLLLVGCVQEPIEEIAQPNDEQANEEKSIVPTYQLSKEDYKMVLPFRPSKARGVIGRQIANRVDIDEIEQGLRRHSIDVFDPEKYFYEDGQYLTRDMVVSWIDELNPERPGEDAGQQEYRENPRYLSHILEQNYLKKNDDNTLELVGVSIGIALKSVYRFQTENGGPYYYEPIRFEEMVKQGEQIAQEILERIRKIDGLQEVPIMIALFQEEEQSSPVPGNFIQKTVVPEFDMMIGKWEKINEDYILFPSAEAREKYFEDYDLMSKFGNEVAKYFVNYVGYIGKGFYMDENLEKLTIDISLEFYGSAEIVGFTQYVYGIVKTMFPNHYDLELKIESSQKLESIIYREAGEEDPTVHILH